MDESDGARNSKRHRPPRRAKYGQKHEARERCEAMAADHVAGLRKGIIRKAERSTQLAPNEPKTNSVPLDAVMYATVPIAISAPTPPRTMIFAGSRSGAGPAPRILLK
jgi:hypothetical protein